MESLRIRFTLALTIVLALAMADILIDAVFDRGQVFKVVAGARELISGKLMGSIKPYAPKNAILGNQVDDPALLEEILICEPTHPAFHIHFLELKGRIWRAELLSDSGAAPGSYPIYVYQRSVGRDPDMPALQVKVFSDAGALRASQASFFRRYLGIAPWAVAGVLAPLVAFLFYCALRASDGSVTALQAQGIGPIYKMAYRKTGWEILFGLGSDHGLRNGDALELLDAHRQPINHRIVAFHVGPQSGEASVDASVKLGPGYLVYRPQSAGPDSTPSPEI
jgi:hypothetical protein